MRLNSTRLRRVLTVVAALLVLKVTVAVIWGYRNYFPPNFNADFLRGRDSYFWGPYQWAFYTHIVTGPLVLLGGMLLISERFRRRFPKWHRYLGRVQVPCVLLVVAPSGLYMAFYAASGPIAGLGLALLAVVTATCAAIGWRAAMQRRFADHRVWMWRTFLLLCSAVVLRLLGGLAVVTGVRGTEAALFDPLAVWISWIAPVAAFEISRLRVRRLSRT